VKGSIGRDHLEADLGPFGSVDLHFEARQKTKCLGPFKKRHGIWTGTAAFVAETGFTSAHATSMPGETLRLSRVCARRLRGENRVDAEFLQVTERDRSTGVETFVSVARVPGRRSNIFASQSHDVGEIEVSNFATDRLGLSRFRYDRERRQAAVRPPEGPFSGRAEARGRTWSGDLTATMPAIGDVALTGPGFRASFLTLDFGRPFTP
jgi:hypothetical protein